MKDIDVLCTGLALVNFPIHPADEGIFARDLTNVGPITTLTGGDAANQAIVLSRLGARVALASRRGDDVFGRVLAETLENAGVDTSGVSVDPERATAVCAMMIKPDGQRHFCSHKGALAHFCFEDVDLKQLARARVASIGGLCAMRSFDGDGAARFCQTAKERDAVTVADTKGDRDGMRIEALRDLLPYTDYFFPSYDEASYISGETEPERIAAVFLRAGTKHVGIKLGGDGCFFTDGADTFSLPAFPKEVVDTTGAGDNFMAGFITGLLRGWDARDCCRFGLAAGAICVSRMGPVGAVKSFGQVMRYMSGCKKTIKLKPDTRI